MANDDKLEKGLEKIFEHLEKRGMMTTAMSAQKNEIIQSLVKSLSGKLDPNDLADRMVQMRLMGAMVCKGLAVHATDKSFINSMEKYFTNTLENDPKAKSSITDKALMLTFTLLKLHTDVDKNDKNALLNQPKSLADEICDTFKKLALKKNDKKMTEEEKKALGKNLDNAKDPLEESLRTMFGGKDPRNTEAVPCVVLAAVAGNQTGMTTQSVPDPVSCSYMVDLITLKTDKEDNAGLEAVNMVADILNGITGQNELEYSMKGLTSGPGQTPTLKLKNPWEL